MSTRPLFLRSSLGVCLAAAAALVALSCGGGGGPNGLTGPEATAARVGPDEDAVVSASGSPAFVDVCHYDATTGEYSELRLPAPALEPHVNHGDFEKPYAGYDCAQGRPVSCPCYTAAGLDAVASTCDGIAPQCLSSGSALSLRVVCEQTSGADAILAGLATTGSEWACETPELAWVPLSEEQYQACLGELDRSVFVTFGPSVCEAP